MTYDNRSERVRRANEKKMNVGMMGTIAIVGVLIIGAIAYFYVDADSMTASSPRIEQSSPPATTGQGG